MQPQTLKELLAKDPMSKEAQDEAAQRRISSPEDRARLSGPIDALAREGYVTLPGLLSAAKLAELRQAMDALHAATPMGKDSFSGFNSQRIFNILEKMPAVHAPAMHPDVVAVIEGRLDDQIQLSSTASNSIHPGQPAQALHCDDTYYRFGRPSPPLGVTCAWAIDSFTEENGATVVIPRSHTQASYDRPDLPARQLTADAGTAVLWDGALWHGAGANRSKSVRRAIIFTYIRGWLRPQENLFLSLSRQTVRGMPHALQRLAGWWVVGGVLGLVDGESPLRVLNRP